MFFISSPSAARLLLAAVSCRKISSRLKPTGAQFSEAPAGADHGLAPVPAGCAALAGFRLRTASGRRAAPSRAPGSRPAPAPAAAARRSASSAPSFDSTSTATISAPRRRLVRFATVSVATSLPLLMMTTRSQLCSTSDRMWVLRMMVCSPARLWIRSRVSMICLGSRPAVGSSRIRTSGLWMMACARPTRCR